MLTLGPDLFSQYRFGGRLDQVGIWNVARTQDQIQADLIRPGPHGTDLLAYWSFDEGSGDTAADLSGNGHTGTLVGPGWSTEDAPLGELHLLVRGYDEALWHCVYDVEGENCLSWSNAAGGILASAPAVVSHGTDQFDVFALGVDNLVYQRHWDGDGWSADWVQEPPDPALRLFASTMPTRTVPVPEWPAPAAVARGGDQIDLFRLAPDNTLRWRHSDDGDAWGAWQNLGGMLASDPGVVSLGPDHMQLFARGVDEALWALPYDGGWGDWERIPLDGMTEEVTIASAPSVISPAADEIAVFVRGSDDQLWSVSFATGVWGAWSALGDSLASGVSASMWNGDAHMFALSAEGQPRHSYDGSVWTDCGALQSQVTYDTGSIAAAPADPAIFEKNFDLDVETGGFLGDRRDQIVIAYRDADAPDQYHIKLYDAQSGFMPTAISTGTVSAAPAARIATGDFDGDGLDEIAVVMLAGNNYDWKVEVYDPYDEGGAWSESLRMVADSARYWGAEGKPLAGTLNITSGDFDGDGLDEIVVLHDWCQRTGSGPYEYAYQATFAIFDDLDHNLDLKGTEGFSDTPTSSVDLPADHTALVLAAGDVDGDGLDEIVRTWARDFQDNVWPVLIRDLQVLDASVLLTPTVQAGMSMVDPSSDTFLESMAVGDLDRDLVEEIALFRTADMDWEQVSAGGPFSVTHDLGDTSWGDPKYYSTIQAADVDGDGQAEMLARASLGMETWRFDAALMDWEQVATGTPAWSDDWGWGYHKYYSTIQAADVDGDGQAELLARGATGMETFHFNADTDTWEEVVKGNPPWSDANDWLYEQYYSTIQAADVDGDGQAELLARGPAGGMEVWHYGRLMVHVYEYNPQSSTIDWLGAADPDPIAFPGLRPTRLVAADYTGESLRVGPPSYRLQNRVDSLVAVINMPPKHRDYIKVDDGGGEYHYELFEVLTEPCWPTSSDPRCTHAKHATVDFEESSTEEKSQRDWAIGGGLDAKVTLGNWFVDLSLKYSYGEHFESSLGVIQSSTFQQAASAYTHDKIVYFGTPYQVWEYPVLVDGTQEPADYITVIFPVPDYVGGEPITRAADTTTGDYPAEPWYRAGHQTYNAWSYDPLGVPGFPDFDPDRVIMNSDCAGGGCGFSFATANSTVLITDTTKTHKFSATVGGGYERKKPKYGFFGAKIRAHVKGSYKKAHIETEKQTTTEQTDISGYINDHPADAQFTTRLIGYWAEDGYLVLDYQTDMPEFGRWADYYSSPDPAFILPWSGFPYGDDLVQPIAGLELFSPEIHVVPRSASAGETVTISATVRNFSNVGVSDVTVRFCQGDPALTCEPPDGEAYIGEVLIPLLDRQDGAVTVSIQWEASGIGEQRIYAVIDPDNTIDPEVHDEDDLINNNVAHGFITIGAAEILDPGLASDQPYQNLSYDQGDSWRVAAYVPPGNLSEVVHFELQDTRLNVPNAVGKPFELVAYEGDEFREEPGYDLSLKPGDNDPPAVIGLSQSVVDVANLKLYRALDSEGLEWAEVNCPGFQIHRFADDNLIYVPVDQAGLYVFSETAPGPVPEPEAVFSAAPTSDPIPLMVEFTDESSNYPDTWLWDFGDGVTSTLQHPSHIYAVPGTYTVTLSVSNAGGSDTEIKPDYITATGLLAAFSAAPVVGSVPLTVTFTDQSVGIPGPINWDWDFGEGGSSAEQHPEYTYNVAGTFTVTLTVSNGEGSDALTVPDCITVGEEPRIYLPLVLRNP
jgi:hypothetical protein